MVKFSYLSFPEHDLKEILTSAQDNKLVFFIGSGFSKFSETEFIKIPDWTELIDELKEDLNLPYESDFLKIAQLYFLKYGQHSYVQKVKSSIKDLEPSSFHKSLFDLNPHYIITTNWDDLIEKTAQDMGLAYDVISSDVDLAQSRLDKKIIKMHGDFRQHNFVFKEDDYLQYSQNFPLVENYIKGIFSTCTIVFLGYSYSDYDLKQIVSWISNISKATPKKYLLQKTFDDAQAYYLRNHGISLLTPMNSNIDYRELYLSFFKDLKTIKDQDELIKEILISAEVELEKIDNDVNFSDAEKNNEKRYVYDFLNSRINKALDNKFRVLSQYKMLLPEQVSKRLTNCTIDYSSSPDIILISHGKYLTTDYDECSRKINNMFFDNVLSVNNKYTNAFSALLEKAFITKVIYDVDSNSYSLRKSSYLFEGDLYKKLMFEYTQDSVDFLFINKDYSRALECLISEVKYFLKEKNYIRATIYMANFDIIYGIIQRSISSKGDEFKEPPVKIIEKFSPFDYKNKVLDFPREMQKDLRELIDILEFNEIYKAYYKFHRETQKNLGYAKLRKDGGIAFSGDEFSIRAKLYPYVYFILGNDIFIEEFVEVKQFFESNIFGSLEHYLIEGKFHVNIMDLFILVKYCEMKKVKEFASRLLEIQKNNQVAHFSAKEIVRIKKYLLVALKNIINLFNMQSESFLHMTSIDRWLNNLLILFGFAKWNDNEMKEVISTIISLLEHRTKNMVIYDNAQYFLTVNALLYKKSHPDILKLLDVVLEKISNNQLNGFDQQIMYGDTLRNIYALSENHNHIYNNTKLISSALLKIEARSDEWKKFITDNLLLDLKRIGSKEIKSIIDDFITKNILVLPCSTPKDYMERLTLMANGYPMPEGFVEELKLFVDNNIPNNLSDLEFIKARVDAGFPELLRFLIKEKNYAELQPILDAFENRTKLIE
ncbi:hypothetical protein AZ003_002833 [Citrobacter freundii]|uniref:SIR2 family protein n=1 Tax=Citrobacter freundii TaxID=546 RepID=UPI000A3C2875|nr:SIR2 family protein [Citrobacter freundii]OUE53926.1 hypothetical protein AZ003_002833 [Citrobacter freundii]